MRLRSANRNNSYNTWNQNSTGNINNNNANNANRFAPVCVLKGHKGFSAGEALPNTAQRAVTLARKGEQYYGDTSNFFMNLGVIHTMDNFYDDEILEKVISFEAIFESMMKCKKGVIWKDSAASFHLNGIEQSLKLSRELSEGTYQGRPPKKFMITSPKPREAVSIAFRDRVYQRSMNDNVIYPLMSQQFIKDNLACQQGKGTDRARERLEEFLHRFYRKHKLGGFVLKCDIHGYYPNMRHDVAEGRFREKLPPVIYRRTETVLREQYKDAVGYNPGSQLIQIAGISVLSPLDHYIKEQLRIKYYLRYMDDFILIHEDEAYLKNCQLKIDEFLRKIGFELHPKKTHITPVSEKITFLGFEFRLTPTGKVVKTVTSETVRRKRRKLRHMVAKCKRGEMPREKVDNSFACDLEHLGKGNSFKLIQRYRAYYKNLWR